MIIAPPAEVLAESGRRVRLGRKLGQGGEGSIYELTDQPDLVAKIFHAPLAPLRAEKIRAMVASRNPALDRLTAWPIELLSLPSGEPVGLTMPKVIGYRDIHQLYSPKSRRAAFPSADWRFLVRVSANVARAFATVHAQGDAIADVNHGGILVGQDARVRLIDCDSFQINAGDRCFPCDVGVPTFTPPELQDQVLTGVVRSESHDNFGLAVMIFLVLFMGRHPYAGRYLGEDDMPIERAIKEHRFAYGRNRHLVAMEQPPGTPPIDIVSAPVAELFERAFAAESVYLGRPTAAEWVEALGGLEAALVECPIGIAHWHSSELVACPWCRVEAATGVPLFSTEISEATAGLFDLAAFWQQLLDIPHPGPAPDITASAAKPKISPVARRALWRRSWQGPVAFLIAIVPAALSFSIDLPTLGRLVFFVAAIVLFFLMRWALSGSLDVGTFVVREHEARKLWQATLADWEAKAGPRRFDDKRAELEKLKDWWQSAEGQPQSRGRIEAAIRKSFDELHQIANQIEVSRTSLRQNVEETYDLLQQTQLDLKTVSKKAYR
jgi:DNA-binding helix-hairpin-helix protein with protein kinase domain